jgi:hypothetical protein
MARVHWGWTKLAVAAVASVLCFAMAREARAAAPVSQISVSDHACAVEMDGSVWCWGPNGTGSIGDGTTTDRPTPVQVSGLPVGDPVTQVSTGILTTYVVTAAHRVYTWGSNSTGQLGTGTVGGNSTVPVQITALGSTVAKISGGDGHACALKTDGTIYCWGANSSGQLGDGFTTNTSLPVYTINFGSNGLIGPAVEVSAGSQSTCAIDAFGEVWCWGNNTFGQLGDGTTSARTTPVLVSTPQGRTALHVSAGGGDTCATMADGTAWCWGYNLDGELGNGSRINSLTPVEVAPVTTYSDSISLVSSGACLVASEINSDDGTVAVDRAAWCWGSIPYDFPQPTTIGPQRVIAFGSPLAQISGGGFGLCVLKANDRSVYCALNFILEEDKPAFSSGVVPGFPAPAPPSVPALGAWTQVALALLLSVVALAVAGRGRRPASA